MSKSEKKKGRKPEEEIEERTEEKTEQKAESAAQEQDNSEADDTQPSEMDALKQELEKQKESYLRLAAEYDNYRKRTANEKASIYSDATAKAVLEILTVADSLEMAQKSAENAPEEFKKGIELVAAQMESALAKLNVESFGKVGDEFDPQLHNAVSKIDSEELGENTVAQIFQLGYKTGDKIIRHAMVQVANCD